MAFLHKRLFLKGLLIVAGLYVGAAVLTLRHGDYALYPARGDGIPVYIFNNGFHTDIALPAEAVRAHGGVLADAAKASGDAKWLVYGWGDAGFYRGKGVSAARIADGLRALFMPGNPSVIRVYGLKSATFAEPQAVLSSQGFQAMARHMEASFVVANGAPVTMNLPATTSFFVSREHFSIFRVCNNWTSDQLAAAGLPTAPVIDWVAPLFSLDLRLRSGVKRAGL